MSTWVRLALFGVVCLVAIAASAQTMYRWVDRDGKVHYADQPPPPATSRELRQQKLGAGNVIETGEPSYAARQAAQKFPLTLYTSANCSESCRRAREFLARRGAPYSEKALATTDDAAEFRQATGMTELFVPVLLAGSKAEKGFEEGAWTRLLDAAGYPQNGAGSAGKPPNPANASTASKSTAP